MRIEETTKSGDNRVDFFLFSNGSFLVIYEYDICLYLNFMLFKITERYKTDKLPSNTHTPPPKLEFFELIRFSRKFKIGKIQKVSGNLLHSRKGSV